MLSKKRKSRAGFTLVELLAVIVIIGILTSGILLSGGAATSSARALNIVNDLRGMKEAVLMMYIDKMDNFDSGNTDFSKLKPHEALKDYVDNPEKYDDAHYGFAVDNGKWYVTYTIQNSDPGAADIKKALTGRAKSAGLFKDISRDPYNGGEIVYMAVR